MVVLRPALDSLARLERGRALLDERLHALLASSAPKSCRRRPPLQDAGGEVDAGPVLHHVLGRATARGPREAIFLAWPLACSRSWSGGAPRGEADDLRLAASIMSPVRMSSLARINPTRRASRCVPPNPGMTPEVHLGLAEAGLVAGVDEVARHRQLAATAERNPFTAATVGMGKGLQPRQDPVPHLREPAGLEDAEGRTCRRSRRPR